MGPAEDKNGKIFDWMKVMELKDLIRLLHIKYLQGHKAPVPDFAKNVLIVAPHPDDEVIGCGGLIARLVAKGRMPHVIVMTGGEGSHRGCCFTASEEISTTRRGLTRKALNVLGVTEDHIHELDFQDGGICEDCNEEIERLKVLIDTLKPETVLVPHWGEGWPDHVNTAQIVKRMVAGKAEVWEYCVWMWYYNVWRGLDWKNAAVLTMTQEEHRLKMEAMDAYIRPTAPCGKPWSGVLPAVFVKAHQDNKELYFKVR